MMNVLTKKEYKQYERVSRYAVFPYYFNNIDKKYIYGITSHLKTQDVSFVSHKIVEGDTLDTLALYYYNSPTFFWIIADFNNILDPYEDLKVGETLKIPTFSNVEFVM